MDVTLVPDGWTTSGSDSHAVTNTVEGAGNVTFLYSHPLLTALKKQYSSLTGVNDNGIYLTGFKLESTLLSSDQQVDNAKVVPLLNGDTITITNGHKAGTLTFTCARTSAGFEGGDAVTVFDYVRSQGDSYGGTLTVTWLLNGNKRTFTFNKVCVKRVAPVHLAGNDVPDYQVQLTYASYSDSELATLLGATKANVVNATSVTGV